MKLFLLDMGDEKYGDCIVVTDNGKSILVDGGHIRDFEQRGSAPSIPDQLADIFDSERPFRFDLLIVTHCHGDHIGCLPTLVADGIVEADWALVAHEDLGYPAIDDAQDGPLDDVSARVVAALREEPRTDFVSDAELDQFLTDAMNLEGRYRQMVQSLRDRGTRIIRFAGVDDEDSADDLRALTQEFAGTGLEILGPTQQHILRCTAAIEQFTIAARRAARSRRRRDASVDALSLYRELAGMRPQTDALVPDDISQFLDRPGKGAALNDQSIVLKFGTAPDTALLTGDMQLAAAEITGLERHMSRLLREIAASAPYAFVKLPHHASYNGFDENVADALGETKLYGVTTGRRDPGHPHEDVLKTLKERRAQFQLVRTDKNGLIEIELVSGQVAPTTSRGRVNDFTINRDDNLEAGPPALPPHTGAMAETSAAVRPPAAQFVQSAGDGVIELTARIPNTATRVTITVDVEPRPLPIPVVGSSQRVSIEDKSRRQESSATPARGRLAAGRTLPRLLFVTHFPKLAVNIGQQEASQAEHIIRNAGQPLLDVRNPDDPFAEVRQAIGRHNPEGIVLLGGLDVIKALRYDTLPDALRAQVGDNGDPDDFIVWSDQAYGDADGDMLGELPVSRIPDGRSAQLVLNALCTSKAPPRAKRFGIRNIARPFAEQIYGPIDGQEPILVSEPTHTRRVSTSDIDATAIYLMLHGSDTDTSRFWGEFDRGGTIEALNVGNIPDPCGGVVFAGCCWGALSVRTPAVRYRTHDPVQGLVPEQSIALAFLARGARAFVGCTGAHYSPVDDRPRARLDYFGGPMHQAFWQHLLNDGDPPARALFKAKMDYIRDMPHGRTTAEEQAIEYKILRQFTCLGLGW